MSLLKSSSILELFWGLSSTGEEERIKSARQLVVGVKSLQGSDEDADSTVQYCLQRLVKGLASNRKGARHGFFVALCELLSMGRGIEISTVLSLIHKHLQQTGNVKAQEERGAHFGLVFALLALVQSEILEQPDDIALVTKELVTAAKKKAYLREFVGVTVVKLVSSVPEEVIFSHVLPWLGLECGWGYSSPDNLLVLAKLQRMAGKTEQYKQFLSKFWGCKKIQQPKNFRAMAVVLLGSSESHPRIHDVWPALFDLVKKKHFSTFWKTTVDESLLTSTHKRRYLAFQLVELLLPSLAMSGVGVVLSPALLQCLKTNASSPKNLLHKAAHHLLHALVEGVVQSRDPGLPVAVSLQFLGVSDPKTGFVPGSDVLRQLLAKVTPAGIRSYVEHCLKDRGLLAYGHLHLLMKQFAGLKSTGWLLPLAQNLLLLAHFAPLRPHTPLIMAVPDSGLVDRDRCSQKLIAVLTSLSSLRRDGESGRMVGEWFIAMVTYAQKLMKVDSDVAVQLHPFNEEHLSAWQNATLLISTLGDKEELSVEEKVFQPLICIAALQLLLERGAEDRESAAGIVTELLACYADMSSAVMKTPRKRRGRGRGVVSRGWVEVLVDLMLSLLSRPQQLWRNVVDRAFSNLLPLVTEEAVQLIVKALEPQAVDELMEASEEDQGEGQEKDDGSEDMDSTEDESGASETTEIQFHDVDAEFRAEVQQALGNLAVYSSDQESIADSSLDNEQMMVVDEALGEVFRKRLEDTAASRKKQKKIDNETVMHFKMRVLDMVDVFIRRGSRNPLVMELVLPLLKLAVHSLSNKTQTTLGEKLVAVFHKLTHMKTYPREGLDIGHAHSLLESLVQQLYRANRFTSPLIIDACLFVVRVLRGSQPLASVSPMATRSACKRRMSERKQAVSAQYGAVDVGRVLGWLSKALEHMITNKNSAVPVDFFKSLSQRQPELSWQLFPTLVACLPLAGSHYRKVLVFQLATVLLSLQTLPDEMVVTELTALAPSLQQACLSELCSSEEPLSPASAEQGGRIKQSKPVILLLDKLIKRLHTLKLRELILRQELLVCMERLGTDHANTSHLTSVLLWDQSSNGSDVAIPPVKNKKRRRH